MRSGSRSILRIGCLLILLALAAPRAQAVAMVAQTAGVSAGTSLIDLNPLTMNGWHRAMTRYERAGLRFLSVLGDIGELWLGILGSVAAFISIAAFASAADRRMLTLHQRGTHAVSRDLGHGIRTFFRILSDRRTPRSAQLLLALALLYWLLPSDLIPDTSWLPGFVDDILITTIAAKFFIYFCPDALVAGHANAVQARARRRFVVWPRPQRFSRAADGARGAGVKPGHSDTGNRG